MCPFDLFGEFRADVVKLYGLDGLVGLDGLCGDLIGLLSLAYSAILAPMF